MKNVTQRRSLLAGLVALVALQIFISVRWLEQDSEALVFDMSEHAQKVVKVHHALARTQPAMRSMRPMHSRGVPDEWRSTAISHPVLTRVVLGPVAGLSNLLEAFYRGSARPSFSYQPAGLLLSVLGTGPDAISLAQGTFWFGVLILATYLFGSAAGGPAVGLLSSVLVSCYPLFVGQAHVPMLDTALAAMTALALAALVRCDDFRSRRASLALGLACGFGLLVKQSFPAVLALPLAWLIYRLMQAVRAGDIDATARGRNAGAAAWAALLVAAPWYVVNLGGTLEFLLRIRELGDTVGLPPVLSIESLLVYPRFLVNVSVGPGLTALAALGILWLCVDPRHKSRVPILLALLGSSFVFVLIHNKDARHFAPALPLLAVASALVILRVPWRRARVAAVAASLLLAGGTLYASVVADLPIPGLAVRSMYAHPPRSTSWRFSHLLSVIERHGEVSPLFVVEPDPPVYAHHLAVMTLPDRLRQRDGLTDRALRILPEERAATYDGHAYVLIVGSRPDEKQRAARLFPGLEGAEQLTSITAGEPPARLELLFQSDREARP